MTEKPKTDWEAIEREFRAGQLSVREIAKVFGISHTAIQKRAKAQGWTQNLVERVREAVATKLVASEVASGNARETVEAASDRVVQIVREHRASIGRGQKIVTTLFDELQRASDEIDGIEAAIEKETSKDTNSNRRNMMLKAVSLSARSSTVGNLANALKTLVGLERQAFNLDDGDGSEHPEAVTRIERVIVDPSNTDG